MSALGPGGLRRMGRAAHAHIRGFGLDPVRQEPHDLLYTAIGQTLEGRRSWKKGVDFERRRLDASKHHQLDLGLSARRALRQVSAIVFLDRVDYFILRDRARGQAEIRRSDGASIYRNVSAELFGFELDVWQRVTARRARRPLLCAAAS